MKNFLLTKIVLSGLIISLAVASKQIDDEVIEVSGPLVVGYFPPVRQEKLDDIGSGASEGIAHVNFAVEDTLKCLEDSGIRAKGQIIMGVALKVKEGGIIKQIALPISWSEAVGVYLFLPGKQPLEVAAHAGPSSLGVLAPEAAAEYFGAEKCR